MSIKIIRKAGEETVGNSVRVINKYQEPTPKGNNHVTEKSIDSPCTNDDVHWYKPRNGLYVNIDGDTSELEEVLEQFRQDDTAQVLMVPIKEPPKYDQNLGMVVDDLMSRVKIYTKTPPTKEDFERRILKKRCYFDKKGVRRKVEETLDEAAKNG